MRKDIASPPSPTLKAFATNILTAIATVPLAIWTEYYRRAAEIGDTFWNTIIAVGSKNWYFAFGSALLLINFSILIWWDIREKEWSRRISFWRARREVAYQKKILTVYCGFLSQVLRVPVSGRCFEVRDEHTEHGRVEKRLYQVRDLFQESEAFPKETAFTFITLDQKQFVSVRAILERSPLYEELPYDHGEFYSEREKRMVEPSQRWVLAAPILRYTFGNRTTDELEPKGALVFYGKRSPAAASESIQEALALSRDAAEIFSNNAISVDDVESR